MDILTLTSIGLACAFAAALLIFFKTNKNQSNDRPSINIDFDTAKDREDKNRYYS